MQSLVFVNFCVFQIDFHAGFCKRSCKRLVEDMSLMISRAKEITIGYRYAEFRGDHIYVSIALTGESWGFE